MIPDDVVAIIERISREDAMKDTVSATPLSDAEKQIAAKQAVIDDLIDERNRIAYVLRTFYFAPISLSAVQPILALCVELNPEIVEQRR